MKKLSDIASIFPSLTLGKKDLLPIFQGGMGIGVSAHRLAGNVAREGAVGTVASVELRRLHPDLMERTHRSKDRALIDATNLEALDREIRLSREICGPEGYIAVNVMKAVDQHADLTRQACESGADAIVMGAGLPMDLPEIVADFPEVSLIPILSEERGVRAILKRWMRKKRLPDAIIIENPQYAGGHLGSPDIQQVNDCRFAFARVAEEIRRVIDQLGLGVERIPLIAAGGINSFERMKEILAMGFSGVQLGTPFAVAKEGDAHLNFKKVLAQAKPEEIVTFLSTAGLPARAVLTPWLKKYLSREERLRDRATPTRGACAANTNCLSHCGLKDGNQGAGQFCIDNQLSAALDGDIEKGLFFRGTEPLPFGSEIRSVRDLLCYMLTGVRPESRTRLA